VSTDGCVKPFVAKTRSTATLWSSATDALNRRPDTQTRRLHLAPRSPADRIEAHERAGEREDPDRESRCYQGVIEVAAEERVIVSSDERRHARPGWCSDSRGGSRQNDLQCQTVVAQAWTFLDGECTADTYTSLCEHLTACESCLDHYALEGRMKNLIASKCGGDEAPEWLRWRS
jgi:anti-sigma factor (TIGR02949 family)